MTDVVVAMTGFAHALRSAGVAADQHRLGATLDALTHVDPFDTGQVYWAARLTLCSEPDDLPLFDEAFDAWFRGRRPPLPVPGGSPRHRTATVRTLAASAAGEQQTEDEALRTAASDRETLRHRDVTDLSAEERVEVQRLIELLRPRVARRPGLRRAPHRRGDIDVARTVRHMLRSGGEPGAIRHRRRKQRPRRLVLLLDVSGSMSPYADVLLRFAHAAIRVAPTSTEVFTISTRLTRVTRQLRLRDADLALRAAGEGIPDWSGGTRLGEALQAFLDRWGQRGTARGAVVVMASDGWERGDAALLGEQMARLRRLAHAVVWVNPHKGKSGFAPATAGMLAALPHLDELVAGHSFDALHQLAEVIARA
jgi:uncharacterized protein with von Willebrand factor type A (vWA) domain